MLAFVSTMPAPALAVLVLSAFGSACLGTFALLEWAARASRRRIMRASLGARAGAGRGKEREPLAIALARSQTKRLQRSPGKRSPGKRSPESQGPEGWGRQGRGRPASWLPPLGPRAQARLASRIMRAGLDGQVSPEGLAAGRLAYSALLALFGALAGAVAMPQAALPLACAGGVAGFTGVSRSLKAMTAQRSRQLESHLSEAVEVICLGLRGGMPLDRSLGMYCACFDTLLSRELRIASGTWASGILTREQALRNLAATYDSAVLSRVVDSIVRSTRFGTPLADSLEVLAHEARASHRAQVQERVMKAPVKMMLPVGALILPSMLLLVMGPVLLELAGGL